MLELALREAVSLGNNYIGPEHILLGPVGENEHVAARILLDFDADYEKIRNEVIRMLSVHGDRQRGSSAQGEGIHRPVRTDAAATTASMTSRRLAAPGLVVRSAWFSAGMAVSGGGCRSGFDGAFYADSSVKAGAAGGTPPTARKQNWLRQIGSAAEQLRSLGRLRRRLGRP